MTTKPKEETETRRVHVDLPIALADKVEQKAKENYRTMRAECAHRIEQSFSLPAPQPTK